jgi:hypothetical protein
MEQQSEPQSREYRINEIYEWLHILNDLFIGIYFLVGSVFFLYPDLEEAGTWLFIIGSGQMLIGPVLRTLNKFYARTIRKKVLHW